MANISYPAATDGGSGGLDLTSDTYDGQPQQLEVSNTVFAAKVNATRTYTVVHFSKNAGGAAASIVRLAWSRSLPPADPTDDNADHYNQMSLPANGSVVLPRGVRWIKFLAAAAVTINLIPDAQFGNS